MTACFNGDIWEVGAGVGKVIKTSSGRRERGKCDDDGVDDDDEGKRNNSHSCADLIVVPIKF